MGLVTDLQPPMSKCAGDSAEEGAVDGVVLQKHMNFWPTASARNSTPEAH